MSVWIVKGGDGDKAWVEEVFADKAKAEDALRHIKEIYGWRGFLYWITKYEVKQ